MENQANQENNIRSEEDKTVAIISYLTLIGWIIAIVMHNGDNKTKLGAFHIRQSLGLMITAFAVAIIASIFMFIPVLGSLVDIVLYLGLFAAWLMGFIAAISGDMKPLPLVGDLFQSWFAGVAKD